MFGPRWMLGVLHRSDRRWDMCDPQQEVLMKRISDDVVALTAKYGGLLWGEHGKVSVRNTVRHFSVMNCIVNCAK